MKSKLTLVASGGQTSTSRGWGVGYRLNACGARIWYVWTASQTTCRVSARVARDIMIAGRCGVHTGAATLAKVLAV